MPQMIWLTHPEVINTPDNSTMSDQHRALQERLMLAGAQKRNFRKHVEAAIGYKFAGAPRIIPDAFSIDVESRRILLFEVCISYVPRWEKLERVASWFAWLGQHGWSARLIYVTERAVLGIDPSSGGLDREHMAATLSLLRGNAQL